MMAPYLEPITQAYINAGTGAPALYTLSIPDARAVLENAQAATNPEIPDSVEYKEITLSVGPTGNITVVVYLPKNATAPTPALAYFHGGGWILGSPVTHKRLCLDLLESTGYAVFFVYYTPSPDAQYPVAMQQCHAAVEWLLKPSNAKSLNIDPTRLAFVGDSVGGEIAASVTIMFIQQNTPLDFLKYIVLFYPLTDLSKESETYTEFANGPGLTAPTLRWMKTAFCPDEKQRFEPIASPLLAENSTLAKFPSTAVIVAGVDPLREEGEHFSRRLASAGVETSIVRVEQIVHDFVMLNALENTPGKKTAIDIAATKLKAALG